MGDSAATTAMLELHAFLLSFFVLYCPAVQMAGRSELHTLTVINSLEHHVGEEFTACLIGYLTKAC